MPLRIVFFRWNLTAADFRDDILHSIGAKVPLYQAPFNIIINFFLLFYFSLDQTELWVLINPNKITNILDLTKLQQIFKLVFYRVYASEKFLVKHGKHQLILKLY